MEDDKKTYTDSSDEYQNDYSDDEQAWDEGFSSDNMGNQNEVFIDNEDSRQQPQTASKKYATNKSQMQTQNKPLFSSGRVGKTSSIGTGSNHPQAQQTSAAKAGIQGTLKGGLKNGLKGALKTGAENRKNEKLIAQGKDPNSLTQQAKDAAKHKLRRRIIMFFMRHPILTAILLGIIFIVIPIIAVLIIATSGSVSSSSNVIEETEYVMPTVKQNRLTANSAASKLSASSKFSGTWKYYAQTRPEEWNTQIDPPWSVSCGVVATSMVLVSYSEDETYNPDWVSTELCGGSAAVYQDSICDYVNAHQDVFGLEATHDPIDSCPSWSAKKDELKEICDGGGCAIIYYCWPHWIVIRSFDGDTVSYADPYDGVERQETWQQLLDRGDNGSAMYFTKI